MKLAGTQARDCPWLGTNLAVYMQPKQLTSNDREVGGALLDLLQAVLIRVSLHALEAELPAVRLVQSCLTFIGIARRNAHPDSLPLWTEVRAFQIVHKLVRDSNKVGYLIAGTLKGAHRQCTQAFHP